MLQNLNRRIGDWVSRVVGQDQDGRPAAVYQKLINELETTRVVGLDGKTVYVANKFIINVAHAPDDQQLKGYVSFLDSRELGTAVAGYCKENRYKVRGDIEFTINIVENEEPGTLPQISVRGLHERPADSVRAVHNAGAHEAHGDMATQPEGAGSTGEEYTVSDVPGAVLQVQPASAPAYTFNISTGRVTLGRSMRQGVDLALSDDPKVSRQHAQIEVDGKGAYVLRDLDSTNGTRVNGRKVTHHTLRSGDNLTIGDTTLVFDAKQSGADPGQSDNEPQDTPMPLNPAWLDSAGANGERLHFPLGSVTLVGRAMTCHVVLRDPSVAMRHARIERGETSTLSALNASDYVLLNGAPIAFGISAELKSEDKIQLGSAELVYREANA